MKKIILVLVVSLLGASSQIKAQDLISGGSNSWIFHTPDDGRTTLHIAPKKNGAYDWSAQTFFKNDGSVGVSKELYVGDKIRIDIASSLNDNSPGLVLAPKDDFLYDGQYINHYGFGFHQFKDNFSSVRGANSYISGYFGIDLFTHGTNRLRINNNGNVGIGTVNPTAKLTVNGKILCEEVEVIQNVLPDYVFQKYYTGASSLKEDYKMATLEEVEAFTKANHHLPDVPSAKVVKEEGLQLKEMTTILLQKIEELTLYTIEQEKRIKALEADLAK